MISTKRLNIFPMTNEQMEQLISEQTISELKDAFSEMLQGCIEHQNQRKWYANWSIVLNDGSDIPVGNLSFKGLSQEGPRYTWKA